MLTPSDLYRRAPRQALLTAAAIATLSVGAFDIYALTSKADAQATAAVPQAIPVKVAPIEEQTVSGWDSFSGRLEAVERVEIRSRVSGAVKAIHFREGAFVREGQLLVTIDPAPYAAEVARARAQVQAAEARLTLARSENSRAERLLTERAISQSEAETRINALILFGLVLAIGIVVDDAIVVVENVERNIEAGKSPKEATYQAMREVSGPIIAIALVLVAVFVPLAFITGLSGQFYRQFSLTIAISTVISAINSLTLSPALAALLLNDHHAKKDALTRFMERWLGGFFRLFNHFFHQSSENYGRGLGGIISRKALMLGVYAVLGLATTFMFKTVPTGFIRRRTSSIWSAWCSFPTARRSTAPKPPRAPGPISP